MDPRKRQRVSGNYNDINQEGVSTESKKYTTPVASSNLTLQTFNNKLSNLQNCIDDLTNYMTLLGQNVTGLERHPGDTSVHPYREDYPANKLDEETNLMLKNGLSPFVEQFGVMFKQMKITFDGIVHQTTNVDVNERAKRVHVSDAIGFNVLSESLIIKIFSYFSRSYLISSITLVCKKWQKCSYSDYIWSKFPVPWPAVYTYYEETNRKGVSFRSLQKSFDNWYHGRYTHRYCEAPVTSLVVNEKFIFSTTRVGHNSILTQRNHDTGSVVRYLGSTGGGAIHDDQNSILTNEVLQICDNKLFSISSHKGDKFVAMWDIEIGRVISAFPFTSEILCANYCPSDNWLTIGGNRNITIYDTQSGKSLHNLQDWAPCIIQNSDVIISGAWRPCKWNKKSLSSFPTFLNNRPTYTPMPLFVNDIKFGPDDQLIMAGKNSSNEIFIVWLELNTNTHIGENLLGTDPSPNISAYLYNDTTKIIIGYKKQLLLDFYDPSDAHEQFSCILHDNVTKFDAASSRLVAADGCRLNIFDFS